MINSVTATLVRTGEQLVIPMSPPDLTGYVIREITGIGPSDATISTLDYAFRPGAYVGNTRVVTREIVMTLVIPGGDAEVRRHLLYRRFPPGEIVRLHFDTGVRSTEIDGYVKRVDPDIFNEEVSVNITLTCPDPHFKGVGVNDILTLDGSAWRGGFTFPVSDPFTFGVPSGNTDQAQTLVYKGDAPPDYKLFVTFKGSPGSAVTLTWEPGGSMIINNSFSINGASTSFQAGDVLEMINTAAGKFLYVTRGTTRVSIISSLNYQSAWPPINLGVTKLFYKATNATSGVMRVEYTNAYLGA